MPVNALGPTAEPEAAIEPERRPKSGREPAGTSGCKIGVTSVAGAGSQRHSSGGLMAAITAGSLATAAAGIAIAFAVAQRRNRRELDEDAVYQRLIREPLQGTPVHAVSADGTQLFAQIVGHDDAPTIVLMPGWTETLHYFDLLARELLGLGFRVVCCDLRDQGASASPIGCDHRIERYGEDLEALLAASCAERDDVVVAGHSLGGMSVAAWAAAFDISARVRAVALINTGMADLIAGTRLWPLLPAPVRNAGERFALTSTEPLPQRSTPISRAVLRYGVFGPDTNPGLIAFFEQMSWETAPVNRAGAGRTVANLDLRSSVAHIAVPAAVIAGAADRMLPVSQAERMAEVLPQLAELLVLPRTGHMSPLERPAEISGALGRLGERVGLRLAPAPHGEQ
jgi:pimeloyl-ACP methyl ester carboxylesterase